MSRLVRSGRWTTCVFPSHFPVSSQLIFTGSVLLPSPTSGSPLTPSALLWTPLPPQAPLSMRPLHLPSPWPRTWADLQPLPHTPCPVCGWVSLLPSARGAVPTVSGAVFGACWRPPLWSQAATRSACCPPPARGSQLRQGPLCLVRGPAPLGLASLISPGLHPDVTQQWCSCLLKAP